MYSSRFTAFGQTARGRQAQKAAVHPPLVYPPRHLVVIAHEHFILYSGIGLLKLRKDLRQPVYGHAGKGAYAHHAGLHPIQPVNMPRKHELVVQHRSHKRQYPLPRRGQAHTASAPLQQGDAPFSFQIAYHFADGGLRIVQALRRPCKASRIDRSDKGEVFQKMVFHC